MNTDSLEVKLGDFSRDDLSPGTKLALHLCLGSTCWDMFLTKEESGGGVLFVFLFLFI